MIPFKIEWLNSGFNAYSVPGTGGVSGSFRFPDQGLGAKFSVPAFIKEHSFSEPQVNAIYRFIFFMAIEGGCNVDEDKYPTMCQWRDVATP